MGCAHCNGWMSRCRPIHVPIAGTARAKPQPVRCGQASNGRSCQCGNKACQAWGDYKTIQTPSVVAFTDANFEIPESMCCLPAPLRIGRASLRCKGNPNHPLVSERWTLYQPCPLRAAKAFYKQPNPRP